MYKKKGFPEKNDLLVCTVKRILPSSAIVELDEYENKEGMVHVSEISRKWVRNIKTYMKPGTKLVCKVMDVDPTKNFINLSVRRVGAAQHRTKLARWKDEKKAHDILEVLAKATKTTTQQIYEKVGNKILDHYGLIFPFFLEIARSGETPLLELKVDKKLTKELTELIQKRITLPKAEISGLMNLSTRASNGLEIIQRAIAQAQEISQKKNVTLDIKYLGAPKYKFKISADDFKPAEAVLDEITEYLEKFMEDNEGYAKIKRG